MGVWARGDANKDVVRIESGFEAKWDFAMLSRVQNLDGNREAYGRMLMEVEDRLEGHEVLDDVFGNRFSGREKMRSGEGWELRGCEWR